MEMTSQKTLGLLAYIFLGFVFGGLDNYNLVNNQFDNNWNNFKEYIWKKW